MFFVFTSPGVFKSLGTFTCFLLSEDLKLMNTILA